MAGLKTHHFIAYLAAGALALIVGLWAGRLAEHNPPQPTVELQGGTPLGHMHRAIPEFTLTDHDGQPFDRSRLTGHWTLMFFGYTHCPDICPMTLAVLAATMQELGKLPAAERPAELQVVFVSVDPERDSPEQLKTYTHYFNPNFLGVTGPEAQINALTGALGILHAKVPDPNNPGGYLVDHSASILVVNPRAELEAVLGAPHSAPVIAADLSTLYTHYE